MISIYTGREGSGKTRHLKKDIKRLIVKEGKTVITNIGPYDEMPIEIDFNKGYGKYIYMPNEKLTPYWLKLYAKENHVQGKEGQSCIIIDDAGKFFVENKVDEWVNFIAFYIKAYAYDIIMAELTDMHVTGAIRQFIEMEQYHRKRLIMHKEIYTASAYWRSTKEPVGKQRILL